MEILKIAASNLKCKIASIIEDNYIEDNYGIKSCNNFTIKSPENLKLELIFIEGLFYIDLNSIQLNKIKSGNYKNFFKRKTYKPISQDIELEDAVIVNITNVNNVVTNITEDSWDQTDW